MKFSDPFGLLTDEQVRTVEGLLARYKGHLSLAEISEGIRITLGNARALLEDATILLSANRPSRSMALLIAGMEEVGKVLVLAAMARIPADNQRLWADEWESLRSHEHKSTWAFPNTYPEEARAHPMLLMRAVLQQATLSSICERLRQFGLYVDYHAVEKRWLSPEEVTVADAAGWRNRLEPALVRVEAFAAAGLFSQRALEIQREVYAEFNRNRPRRKDLQLEQMVDGIHQGPQLAQTYFRRLIQEGIISPDADTTIAGVPLADLVSDLDQATQTETETEK